MNNWRSLPSKGGLIGIGLTVVFAIGVVVLLVETLANLFAPANAGANVGTFILALCSIVLLLLALFLGWRTWCYFNLRYFLDRNSITINLGDSRQIIPLGNIQEVVSAENLLASLQAVNTNGEIATQPIVPIPNTGSTLKGKISNLSEDEFFAEGPISTRSNLATKTAPKIDANTNLEAAADSSFDEPIGPDQKEELEPDKPTEEVEYIEGEVLEDEVDIPPPANNVTLETPTNLTNSASGSDEVGNPTIESGENESQNDDKIKPDPVTLQNQKKSLKIKMGGLRWPGYYFNMAYFQPMGQVQFYSTTPFVRTILIRTYNITYAISPSEPQKFLTELKLRRNLGATDELEEIRQPGLFLAHPLWHDWIGRALITLGIICNLALFLYMLLNFQDLPQNVQIHFNKFGEPDRIGQVGDLIWLPTIGLITLIANSLLGAWVQFRDRIPAYLLYIASIVIQFLIALALAGILGGSAS